MDQENIKKMRKYYSIIAPLILCAVAGISVFLVHSSIPERRLMMQLRRAKTLDQVETIRKNSGGTLSDDRMAEVYFSCALATFARKDYEESFKLLRKVLESEAHIEFKATAQFELANAYFLAGKFQEGLRELELLAASPSTPPEIREKAVILQQRVRAGAL